MILKRFRREVSAFKSSSSLPANAEDRYSQLKLLDPYPTVAPALLHAGHLASYVIAAGMIDPFDVKDLTKPATYLVPLEGLVRYVDQDGTQQRFFLSKHPCPGEVDVRSFVDVQPNAVCYVTLRPKFRFPAYIAARFNLLIRDYIEGFWWAPDRLLIPASSDGSLSQSITSRPIATDWKRGRGSYI